MTPEPAPNDTANARPTAQTAGYIVVTTPRTVKGAHIGPFPTHASAERYAQERRFSDPWHVVRLSAPRPLEDYS